MQTDKDKTGRPSGLRRWGPAGAIAAVVVVAIAAMVVTRGSGDDDTETGDGPEAATEVTTADGDIVYPLSFTEAQQAGLEGLDWGERCDPERGHLAVPDPAAPECYLPFEGENGGASDDGVTEDTIKIVLYQGPDDDPILGFITDAIQVDESAADREDTLQHLISYYETYHETYGRQVELEVYQSGGFANDETTARADAVTIAEDIQPFQVWGGPALTEAFAEELAARGVQCLGCAGGDQEELEERAPYGFGTAWNSVSSEQGMAHNVEALANTVAGRNAEFAGDDDMQGEERRFGYLYAELNEETAELADTYRDLLADEGVELVEMIPYAVDPATLQETASSAIARLKQAGVTTVVFGGDPIAPREFTREATAQDYFPEWFLNLSLYTDSNVFARTYDQQQWAHAFGITALPARVDPEASGPVHLYEWFFGERPRAEGTIGALVENGSVFYRGLQEAGPDLTHESFRDALFRLEPSDPLITQPSLSWGDHGRWPTVEGEDYQGTDDATMIWWDAEATGPDELGQQGDGMWQFVDGGRRYLSGEWPEADFPAFAEAGAVALYEAPPDEAATPGYEPLDPVRQPPS